MEMGKIIARVSTEAFVTKHSTVFSRTKPIITFQFANNSFYSVNLKCVNNTKLKLSSLARQTNQNSKKLPVAGADETRVLIRLRVSFYV